MNLPAVLSHPLLAQAPVTQPENHLGSGETVLFWILAPLMVIAALGLLFARKAVHAAMMLAAVMIGLAVIYAVQDAQFLFAAQIVVYTGAVMMLFLFVLMLVGVDSSDSLVETIKGQRFWAVIGFAGALLFGVGMVTGFMGGRFGVEKLEFLPPNGLAQVNEQAGGNPKGVAKILFSDYFVTFELTGALLITAALGAMVLTHRERLVPRVTQKVLSQRRILANRHVAGLPAPGVFARHNSVDTPALLPDGTPSELSVNRVLRARGQELPGNARIDAVEEISAEIEGAAPKGLDDVGDRMDRGVTGTQLPDDKRVDGTNEPVEEPQEGRTR
ncbi:MAG TPA: NADH-quinone oxidoreductase subunit J [Actinomycetales bacterium]|nr:NADH-quinone oxidoreductase subunit J [Actinomycetales bacterium]